MKKLIIFALLLIGSSSVVAQEASAMLKEVQRLTLENDSLKKVVNSERNKLNEQTKYYVDSIKRLNKFFTDSLAKSKDKYKQLESVVSRLQKDLDKERKNAEKLTDIKAERDELKQRNTELLDSIEEGKTKLENEKKEQYEMGRKSVLDRIKQTYSYDFDVLVLSVSLQTIQRDLPFVEDANIKKKMQDLQIFYEAKQVLKEKYNEQKVSQAQKRVQNLNQTNAVKNLGKSLENYKLSYEALRETIGRIKEIDRQLIANDDYSIQQKTKDILAELADYLYNYKFNFEEYPYLSNLVMEIVDRKKQDVNSSVSDLYDKL